MQTFAVDLFLMGIQMFSPGVWNFLGPEIGTAQSCCIISTDVTPSPTESAHLSRLAASNSSLSSCAVCVMLSIRSWKVSDDSFLRRVGSLASAGSVG